MGQPAATVVAHLMPLIKPAEMDEWTQIVFFILACLLGSGMILSLGQGVFSPYFLFFSYLTVSIVIRGLYLLDDTAFDETDFWSMVAPHVQHAFLPAYLELLAAIVIAVITSRIFTRIRNPMEDGFLRFLSLRSDEITFIGTMLVALLSCMTFVLALGASQGGLTDAFVLLQKRALVFGSEVFFIRILSVVFSVAVCLLVYKISVERRSSSSLRKAGVITVVLLNVGLLLLSGGRGAVMTQVLALLYVRNRGLDRGDFGMLSILFLGGIGTLVVVGGMAMRRSAQFGINLSEAIVESVSTGGHTLSGAFPITDLYLSARNFADSIGHDYGMQFLLYFVRFIPRSIWEDKPYNLGYTIHEFYSGETLAGAIPTIFGEFYIAWGFIGIIICGIFLGWMLSFLDRAYRHAREDSKFALIYVMLATGLVFDGLRAGLEMALFMILYILMTLTCFKLAAQLTRSPVRNRLQ